MDADFFATSCAMVYKCWTLLLLLLLVLSVEMVAPVTVEIVGARRSRAVMFTHKPIDNHARELRMRRTLWPLCDTEAIRSRCCTHHHAQPQLQPTPHGRPRAVTRRHSELMTSPLSLPWQSPGTAKELHTGTTRVSFRFRS
jgi:hypothetical protein